MFINIVSSDKIREPIMTPSEKGQQWQLPYSLGPPHMETDSSGQNAAAFDCCFHPEALRRGVENKRFKELLVKTAMDGVVQAYKLQRQQVCY